MIKTKIIAHRGDTKKFPENSIAAFHQAIKHGADKIELDVHYSKDKKLVIHHDYAIGDSNTKPQLIYKSNTAFIKSIKLDFDEGIPFLEDVFTNCGKKIEYEIELKAFDEDFLLDVVACVKKFDLMKYIEFTSGNIALLIFLKNKFPDVKIGTFIEKKPDWMDLELVQKLSESRAFFGGFDVLHTPVEILTEEWISTLHKKGLIVHAANCDSENDLMSAFRLKVDQLSTNKLELALKVREKFI